MRRPCAHFELLRPRLLHTQHEISGATTVNGMTAMGCIEKKSTVYSRSRQEQLVRGQRRVLKKKNVRSVGEESMSFDRRRLRNPQAALKKNCYVGRFEWQNVSKFTVTATTTTTTTIITIIRRVTQLLRCRGGLNGCQIVVYGAVRVHLRLHRPTTVIIIITAKWFFTNRFR